jgi:hypothetical protein
MGDDIELRPLTGMLHSENQSKVCSKEVAKALARHQNHSAETAGHAGAESPIGLLWVRATHKAGRWCSHCRFAIDRPAQG